jgi:hypothetical protein
VSENWPFEKFIAVKPPSQRPTLPQNMVVGQVVVRHNVPRGTISGLRSLMRKAMRAGASFSVCETETSYVIRRDE